MKKKVSLLVLLSLLLQGFIMPTTSPLIILTLSDAELSSVASSQTHARADIDDLVTGEAVRNLKYATYEPDKWLLDGSFHFAPDPAHIGFVSDEISLVDKSFTSDPVITITLDAVVDIEQGITLEFSKVTGDYCTELLIEYYDNGSSYITGDVYSINEYNYFAEAPTQPVEDVKYIVITFRETNIAYRHVKLLDVYVDGAMFDKDKIKTANIIEEIDPISAVLPSNTLDFTLYNQDGDFSIVDPQGIYAGLKENQRVDAYEFVDSDRIYMGRFYLKYWNSRGENLAVFECVDAIAILGKTTNGASGLYSYVYGSSSNGTQLNDQRFEDLVDSSMILSGAYYTIGTEMSTAIGNLQCTGLFDYGLTIRDTFRLMSMGSLVYADCSKSKNVVFSSSTLIADVAVWDFILSDADVSIQSEIKLKPLITVVKLTSHSYPIDGKHVDFQVYDGDVSIGDEFVIIHPRDYYGNASYVRTGTATIGSINTGIRFMSFTITGSGTLNIYYDESRSHNKEIIFERLTGLPDNYTPLVLEINESTMVTPYNASDVLSFIFDYSQQRYFMVIKVFAKNIAVGNSIKVDVQGKELWGIAERVESDLSGGFVQKVTVVGEIH